MVVVDLKTKIIGPNHKAYVVHAGRAQKYYPIFERENSLFLGLSRVRFNEKILNSKEKVRQAIRLAIARNEYFDSAGTVNRPSDDFRDYDGSVFEEGNLTKFVGSAIALFKMAKPGDLIITPGHQRIGAYNRSVISFGEIETPFSTTDVLDEVDRTTISVPFRRVRWLKTVPRRSLELPSERRIGKPPAAKRFEIDELTSDVLKLAYENYIYAGTSTGLVKAGQYEASKFLTLTDASDLISILVAAHEAFLVNRLHGRNVDSVKSFRDEWFPRANVENIEVVFSSPGQWRIVAASLTLAAFIAVGVAIFSSELSINELVGGVTLENSYANATPEDLLVEQSINMMLNSITNAELEQLKGRAREASAQIGFQSPAQARR